MNSTFKRNKFLKEFQIHNHENTKYPIPLILKMYGALNIVNLKKENRYILCNFIDQYGDLMNIEEDIYLTNNSKALNQLFILAIKKAYENNLLNVLFDDYLTSFNAIREKKEFQNFK